MKFTKLRLLAIFLRGFNSSKCKTWLRMTTARIKLLRNKRQAVVKQMRRDVALLLQSGQDATARIRVEHVIREQNAMAANEIIELFCDQIVARLSIISKQRDCPADLKEGIASLIFAAPRCSDVPELLAIRDIFEKKYGKDFVSAATDLRPESGVNRLLIEKLSARNSTGEVKLKVMKEIAKEYKVEWDTTDTEMELLKPPEERIEGPRTFVSAASLPVKSATRLSGGGGGDDTGRMQASFQVNPATRRFSGGGNNGDTGCTRFDNAASAAKVAAESAKTAVAAAQAAAELARKESQLATSWDNSSLDSSNNPADRHAPSKPHVVDDTAVDKMEAHWRVYESRSFARPHCPDNGETGVTEDDHDQELNRRHSYDAPSEYADIKFDESDCDEEFGTDTHPPPDRNPPPLPSSDAKHDPAPQIHPKLPDYDALAARFEALKYRKWQG